MNILFISKYKWPHIGGVEKHIDKVSKILISKGHTIKYVTTDEIKPPRVKYLGLICIWYWFLKNIKIIRDSEIVHIHDVFIWYLPFRFVFPFKKVFVTFHGWEGKWPISNWAIFNKKIANYLSNGSIAVGKYIEKWYGIKANFVIHGGIEKISNYKKNKIKNTVVWLGRQDEDTGILEFKKWLADKPQFSVKYITNIKNPERYLITSEYCVPSGYLSYLEAKSYGCKIKTFATNPLKEDYWNEIKALKSIPTWKNVAGVYIKLWNK